MERAIQFQALGADAHKRCNIEANKVTATSTDVPTVQMTNHRLEVISIRAIGAPKYHSDSHTSTSI